MTLHVIILFQAILLCKFFLLSVLIMHIKFDLKQNF